MNQTENPNSQPLCIYCRQKINADVSKCHYCHSYQKKWKNWLSYLAIPVSIAMVLVAAVQVIETRQKRVEATVVLKKANDMVKELTSLNEFLLVRTKAQNDDREAYDQLYKWREDKSYIYSELAETSEIRIRMYYHERKDAGMRYLTCDWKKYVKDVSFEQALNLYYEKTPSPYRPGCVTAIWKTDNFSKKQRIQFLIDVLQNDKNLRAIHIAGTYMQQETGREWNPFSPQTFYNWWEENKDLNPFPEKNTVVKEQ